MTTPWIGGGGGENWGGNVPVGYQRVGLSTDTKPILPVDEQNARYYEADTNKHFIWDGSVWRAYAPSGEVSLKSTLLDRFGRIRTGEPFGLFDNKNISSRNRNQWEEPISGVILTYNTLTLTFTPGEEIRGTLPSDNIPLGTVNTDNGSSSMNIDCDHNDFQVGDTITGQTSGATAVLLTTNTGSDVQHDYDRSSVMLTCGIGATDSAVRHSHKYNAYVPKKSQAIADTFVMGAAKANVRRRAGYFDTLNGLFLEQNGVTDVAMVIRSSTSGSPVDTRYLQADWNMDTLDGSGDANNPSGIELNLSQSQILAIDFQWLGVGAVAFGFDIDNELHYTHIQFHANRTDVVYMKTPSLPVRYEITNTGVPASPSTLEEICSSVVSEGGYSLPGLEFSESNDITPRVVSTTLEPVLAVRLKNNFPAGEPNRRIAKFLNAGLMGSTNDALIEVHHIHEPIDITATWADIGGGSALEYSTDISAITGRPFHKIEHEFLPTTTAGKSNSSVLTGEFINLHGFISQSTDSDNSQMFVIYGRSFTGNANISAHITTLEFE